MINYIGYDYKEISCDKSKISQYIDFYEALGWKLDENAAPPVPNQLGKAVLHLKRDRKIVNKTELTRLERNFEACINEIDKLEASKRPPAVCISLIIGIIGTAFMAGSVFAITADPPTVWLCILLAVPAFACWIAAPLVYRKISNRKTKELNILIEKKYDEIYKICEKGNSLL